MGNTAPEQEVIYDALSAEVAAATRTKTSQAYELAIGATRSGLLCAQDRLELDRRIAEATKAIYAKYVAREKDMLRSMEDEIARLKHECVKARRRAVGRASESGGRRRRRGDGGACAYGACGAG